jgi:Cft2 family RNA processing exonuclease
LIDIDFTPNGISLPAFDLWLDPRRESGHAWVSHAHSDHACGLHGEVWASPATLEIYRLRFPLNGREQVAHPMAWGEPVTFRGAQLTAFPAGHILGAAQLLIETDGERIVYTGDIKLRPPLCGEKTEVVACDRLIIESTFGLPVYHFLDREAARDRITAFARETLADGGSAVFLGYPLGRGQEIVHVLSTAGIPVRVHGAIARYIPVYERAGIPFGPWEPYSGGALDGKRGKQPAAERAAYVVVPGMRAAIEASPRDCRIAYVSGWAALGNARTRSGAEELIPYSDHADFEELIELIEKSGARRVDLVHGYGEPLARILQARGIEAHAPEPALARSVEEAAE